MSLSSGLTIEDYEKLPDALALDHELVDGELVDRAAVAGRRLALPEIRNQGSLDLRYREPPRLS